MPYRLEAVTYPHIYFHPIQVALQDVSLLNRYVYGFTSDEPNDELVLTIRYTENGVLCETTYTISVSEG